MLRTIGTLTDSCFVQDVSLCYYLDQTHSNLTCYEKALARPGFSGLSGWETFSILKGGRGNNFIIVIDKAIHVIIHQFV